MKTIFKNNGGTYTQTDEYMLPNLTLSDGDEKQIGVWAMRYRRYLKSSHRVLYYNLLTSSRLYNYLADIEERAKSLFEQTVKSLAEQEQITEKLKVTDMMLWVQKMILSILVDTFISKISFPMQPGPEIGSISDA